MANKVRWIAAALAVMLLCLYVIHGNKNIGITEYEISSGKLPAAFDGFRAVQVSDLHNEVFGENNCEMISLIRQAEPDAIFITGDMVDSRNTHIETALNAAEAMLNIAPVYYVNGNHEARISQYRLFEQELKDMGVTVLRNEAVCIQRDGARLYIAGLDDPAFIDGNRKAIAMKLEEIAAQCEAEEQSCTVLLAHRPELFELYSEYDISFVFSGHTHGGQIRLPLLGGVYAPGSGFFPKYDGGVFHSGNSTMTVSRGIGNSLFPVRVNNDPEIVLAVFGSK